MEVAWPFDTKALADGSHVVSAEVVLVEGGSIAVSSTFEVRIVEEFPILSSFSANRSAPGQLQGSTVSGNLYAFLDTDAGISQVRFYLDDSRRVGVPQQIENIGPYDLGGGSVESAWAFNTSGLSNETHTLSAEVVLSSGEIVVKSAQFTVWN